MRLLFVSAICACQFLSILADDSSNNYSAASDASEPLDVNATVPAVPAANGTEPTYTLASPAIVPLTSITSEPLPLLAPSGAQNSTVPGAVVPAPLMANGGKSASVALAAGAAAIAAFLV